MTQVLIPLLAFLSVIAMGGAVLAVRGMRSRMLAARLYGSASEIGGVRPSSGFVGAVDQIGRAVSQDKAAPGLRETLTRAGCYDPAAPSIYMGSQLVLVLVGLSLGGVAAFSAEMSMLLRSCVLLGMVAAFALLPNGYVSFLRRRRTAEIRRTLPDAIDLLEICVSSGMGLDLAWNSVADEIRGVSAVLADEMALANLEIHLGAPRADALRHMASRTGAREIASLVATLVQSEQFGTSVSQALRVFADSMRADRSQRADEAAEKLMVKLLVPMVMFIFPCMFIVILGPAAIRMAAMFRNE